MTFLKRKKRIKKEGLELDITSLLDILVILLVFLLKSYNASDLELNVQKNLMLAKSNSSSLGSHAITVQVNKKGQYFVDDQFIETNLYPVLKQRAKKQLKSKKKKESGSHHLPINLVFDKSLSYKIVQDVMETAANAGFSKFKLIVQGKKP